MQQPLAVENKYISKTKYGLCKNYGCSGKRTDGSAFCKRCSEWHNKLTNNINDMEPDAMDVLHDFRKEIDACVKTAEGLKGHTDANIFIRELSLVKTKLQNS
jgi:hypothetical protein